MPRPRGSRIQIFPVTKPDAHPDQPHPDVTLALRAVSEGDASASEALLPLVYEELRRLAAARMAQLPPGQTLQPTALVHDAYLKLVGSDQSWNSRGHFFGAAARAMRNILVDQARRKGSGKHGGGLKRETLSNVDDDAASDAVDHVVLDAALSRLEAEDPQRAEIVNLRYFAGLSVEETAAALGIGTATVKRHWRYARAWLRRELEEGG